MFSQKFNSGEELDKFARNSAEAIVECYLLSEEMGHSIPFSLVSGIYNSVQETLHLNKSGIPFDRLVHAYCAKAGIKSYVGSSLTARLRTGIEDPAKTGKIKDFGNLIEAASRISGRTNLTDHFRGQTVSSEEASQISGFFAYQNGLNLSEAIKQLEDNATDFFDSAETQRLREKAG